MNRRFILAMSLICVALVTGSFSAAFSAEKVRGVTDTEIIIGQWGPQTGPAALWGAVARGTGVFFDMLNEEGGIAGRKIK